MYFVVHKLNCLLFNCEICMLSSEFCSHLYSITLSIYSINIYIYIYYNILNCIIDCTCIWRATVSAQVVVGGILVEDYLHTVLGLYGGGHRLLLLIVSRLVGHARPFGRRFAADIAINATRFFFLYGPPGRRRRLGAVPLLLIFRGDGRHRRIGRLSNVNSRHDGRGGRLLFHLVVVVVVGVSLPPSLPPPPPLESVQGLCTRKSS